MPNTQKDLRRKILGRKGESATCKYLKKNGYKILKRNYKTPFGECDIIAYKGGMYCFVEVKTRVSDVYGLPAEAVDRAKRQRYRMIAKYFCNFLREEVPCRYDVASILELSSGFDIEYFENAFI